MLAKEVLIQLTAGPAAIRAWARGAREVTFIGAVGTRLDYVIVAHPSVRNANDLKGKRIGVSQLGASPDFIARLGLRRLGLNPEKDVRSCRDRRANDVSATAGHVRCRFSDTVPLRARKAVCAMLDSPHRIFNTFYPEFDHAFVYSLGRETVMNYCAAWRTAGFYRDDRNREKSIRFLSEYYRSNANDELGETINVYSRVTPGLPLVTAKSIENVIANDEDLSGMGLKAADMLDLSFLQRIEEERKTKGKAP